MIPAGKMNRTDKSQLGQAMLIQVFVIRYIP